VTAGERLALLRERLAGDAGGVRFAEAICAQLLGPAGALGDAPDAEREALTERVATVVLESARARDDALALRLLGEPALAAAFFENLDLLYDSPSAYADAVGALVMRVLELAPGTDSGRAGR
jgi:hypothetical protein